MVLIVASETCAFDVIGAEYIRDVQPGELIVIDQDGLQTAFTRTSQTLRISVIYLLVG